MRTFLFLPSHPSFPPSPIYPVSRVGGMERYDEFVLRGDLKNVWFTFQIICFIMYASSSSWRWWTLMRCLSGPGHRAGTLLTLTHANLGHNILRAGLESVSVICCIKYLCLMFYFPRGFESFSVWPWFTKIVVGTSLTIINFIVFRADSSWVKMFNILIGWFIVLAAQVSALWLAVAMVTCAHTLLSLVDILLTIITDQDRSTSSWRLKQVPLVLMKTIMILCRQVQTWFNLLFSWFLKDTVKLSVNVIV